MNNATASQHAGRNRIVSFARPQAVAAATVTGSALVAAIESFWNAVVARHPELPAEVIVVTGSGAKPNYLVRGHWAINRWTAGDRRAPELFIAGERIADGAEGVATTVIHEAAHALLQARGDLSGGTSRQGRYHTKSGFAAAAVELGLVPPATPDSTLGFSDCTLPAVTAETYKTEIDALRVALAASINGGRPVAGPEGEGAEGAEPVAAPRTPRQYRKARRFACECREFAIPAAMADEFDAVACLKCLTPFIDQTDADAEG